MNSPNRNKDLGASEGRSHPTRRLERRAAPARIPLEFDTSRAGGFPKSCLRLGRHPGLPAAQAYPPHPSPGLRLRLVFQGRKDPPVKANNNNHHRWAKPHRATFMVNIGGHPAGRRGRPVAARVGAQSSQSAEHGNGHPVGLITRLYGWQHARHPLPGPAKCAEAGWIVRSKIAKDGRRLITLAHLSNGARARSFTWTAGKK
jgi:hypothetical protein